MRPRIRSAPKPDAPRRDTFRGSKRFHRIGLDNPTTLKLLRLADRELIIEWANGQLCEDDEKLTSEEGDAVVRVVRGVPQHDERRFGFKWLKPG